MFMENKEKKNRRGSRINLKVPEGILESGRV
jgi:hypothetical protein